MGADENAANKEAGDKVPDKEGGQSARDKVSRLTFVPGQSDAAVDGSALETMKIRCFQTAADFVSRGLYQEALDQIRYVIEVDPRNTVARDFERKVVAMAVSQEDREKEKEKKRQTIIQPVAQKPAPAEKQILPPWLLILIVVLVVLIAGFAGYFFASR